MAASYFVLAFDIETSGCSVTKNGIVSIGCTLQDQDSNELSAFQVNLSLPKGHVYEEACLNEFWLKNPAAYDFVRQNPLAPKEAMEKFCDFLSQVEAGYPDVMLVTDNPGFDIAWLNFYLDVYTTRLPLNYSVHKKYRPIWDLTSMHRAMLPAKTGHLLNLLDLAKELGFKSKWPYDHTPLNDARNIADIYNQTIKRLEK